MAEDSANFVTQCHHCNRRKPWHEKPQPNERNIQKDHPMQCWALDIVGPLPTIEAGNRYILTMCDSFTRWAEAIPLKE